jgi:hypothetical protein
MIKFEFGMLVLDKNATKEDVEHIHAYTDFVRKEERERVLALMNAENE